MPTWLFTCVCIQLSVIMLWSASPTRPTLQSSLVKDHPINRPFAIFRLAKLWFTCQLLHRWCLCTGHHFIPALLYWWFLVSCHYQTSKKHMATLIFHNAPKRQGGRRTEKIYTQSPWEERKQGPRIEIRANNSMDGGRFDTEMTPQIPALSPRKWCLSTTALQQHMSYESHIADQITIPVNIMRQCLQSNAISATQSQQNKTHR